MKIDKDFQLKQYENFCQNFYEYLDFHLAFSIRTKREDEVSFAFFTAFEKNRARQFQPRFASDKKSCSRSIDSVSNLEIFDLFCCFASKSFESISSLRTDFLIATFHLS